MTHFAPPCNLKWPRMQMTHCWHKLHSIPIPIFLFDSIHAHPQTSSAILFFSSVGTATGSASCRKNVVQKVLCDSVAFRSASEKSWAIPPAPYPLECPAEQVRSHQATWTREGGKEWRWGGPGGQVGSTGTYQILFPIPGLETQQGADGLAPAI